jgi:choice-of-anchor B domain-containing protein
VKEFRFRRTMYLALVAAVMLLVLAWAGRSQLSAQELGGQGTDESPLTQVMQAFLADWQPPENLEPMAAVPCVGGMAGSYPCSNVDLLAFMPLATIGGGNGNDSWGWTDSLTGKEYAIMGRSSGTSFIDISDPVNPIYLGNLPTHTVNSSWRDIKVYGDHAFIVSEASNHGMQVFDLTELRTVASPPVTFSESAYYGDFGRAHNLVINEDSGYAYAVGTSTCSGGLHMVNIQNPLSPTNAGCFSADGYTHDAQCVNYTGPDPDHQGKEICFASNEDTLTIVDVTNKAAPVQLSRTPYAGSAYTHQNWITDDHVYVLVDDELDEMNFGHNTRTRIFDVSDLDQPVFVDYHNGRTPAIDHNMYIHNGYVYQANYRSGLSILDISDVANGNLTDVGYFDIYPSSDSPNFNGAWSTYPYYDSGVVIVSGIEQGLFILQPHLSASAVLEIAKSEPEGLVEPGQTITYTITLTNSGILTASDVIVTDTLNGNAVVLSGPSEIAPGDQASYLFTYTVQVSDCGQTLSNEASASSSTAATVTLPAPVETPVVCTVFSVYLPLIYDEP